MTYIETKAATSIHYFWDDFVWVAIAMLVAHDRGQPEALRANLISMSHADNNNSVRACLCGRFYLRLCSIIASNTGNNATQKLFSAHAVGVF